MSFQAVIFDLDGVICFTDEYHYRAWKILADELKIRTFSADELKRIIPQMNEALNMRAPWSAFALSPIGYAAGAPRPFSRKAIGDVVEIKG